VRSVLGGFEAVSIGDGLRPVPLHVSVAHLGILTLGLSTDRDCL
jgi:hypothetical protein